MADRFDPAAFPALVEAGSRLRELAGDTPYQAGREYLRKGRVKQGAVAGATAYATVTGSTEYRVSVGLAGEVKVTCTCPAHRRSRYCKHVVAVCAALLEHPADFTVSEALPEAPPPPPAKGKRTAGTRGGGGKVEAATTQGAGLDVLDRLLDELAASGVLTLGTEQAALLANAGELVRALRLRRMGNLVRALQRAATGSRRTQAAQPAVFAHLLVDLWFTRQAVGAQREGRVELDPRLAEDLLGKTWRESELELVHDLELMELASTREDDGEFGIETGYLADLASGTLFVEQQITPLKLHAAPRQPHRHRVLVEEGGLYPGEPPRRLRLARVRHEPLTVADVGRWLPQAPDSVADLRRRLVEHLRSPFAAPETPVAFHPAALVAHEGKTGALDREGTFLSVIWPDAWTNDLPDLLPDSGRCALFGLLGLNDRGLVLRCLSVVSDGLRWDRGPVYPDGRSR